MISSLLRSSTAGYFSTSWCFLCLNKPFELDIQNNNLFLRENSKTIYDCGVQPEVVRRGLRLSYWDWKKKHLTFNLQLAPELTTGKINNVTEKIKLVQIDL